MTHGFTHIDDEARPATRVECLDALDRDRSDQSGGSVCGQETVAQPFRAAPAAAGRPEGLRYRRLLQPRMPQMEIGLRLERVREQKELLLAEKFAREVQGGRRGF